MVRAAFCLHCTLASTWTSNVQRKQKKNLQDVFCSIYDDPKSAFVPYEKWFGWDKVGTQTVVYYLVSERLSKERISFFRTVVWRQWIPTRLSISQLLIVRWHIKTMQASVDFHLPRYFSRVPFDIIFVIFLSLILCYLLKKYGVCCVYRLTVPSRFTRRCSLM